MVTTATRSRMPIVSVLLVGLCALLVSGGAVARWAHQTAADTESWTESTNPLFGDREIIREVSEHLATEILKAIDLSQISTDLLPEALGFLGTFAEDAATVALVELIDTTLRQPGATQFLTFINREAHELTVAVLLDQHEYLHLRGDELVLDLDPVLSSLLDRLHDLGIPVWEDGPPPEIAEFVLITSASLGEAQRGLEMLDRLAWLLPLLAALCAVGALALSRDRTRTVMFLGLTVAGAALCSLAIQSTLGVSLVSRWTDPVSDLLGRQIWDVAARGLVTYLLAVAAAGMAITVAISVVATVRDVHRETRPTS